ncbi:MAG: hypothetical protein QW813_03150 [Candidatus Aenigmatarchaeota archaeon]
MVIILERLLRNYEERTFWRSLLGMNRLHLATQAELQTLAHQLNLR